MDRNDVLWQCQVHRWLLLTSGYCTVTILTPMAQEPLNFIVAATSAAADRRQKTTATGSTNRSTLETRFVDLVYVPYGTCMLYCITDKFKPHEAYVLVLGLP